MQRVYRNTPKTVYTILGVVQQLWAVICASRVTDAQISWRISMDLLRKMLNLTGRKDLHSSWLLTSE